MDEGKHRRDYNVWERAGEVQSLRDQLAAAIRVARRYSRQCDTLRAALAALRDLPLYRLVALDDDGNSAEPVNVVGVHPLRWRDAGHIEPTHAFTPLDWEDIC